MKKVLLFFVIFLSQIPLFAVIVTDSAILITSFFPKNINGEKGIFAQYRTLDGLYHNLENTGDYFFEKPDNSLKLPIVGINQDDPFTIFMHPAAKQADKPEVRIAIVRIVLDGQYDSLYLKGSVYMVRPLKGQVHFSIYKNSDSYNLPIWISNDPQDTFNLIMSYKKGDELFLAAAPWSNIVDFNEGNFWQVVTIRGIAPIIPLTINIPNTTAIAGSENFPLQIKYSKPAQMNLTNKFYKTNISFDASIFLPSASNNFTEDTIINDKRILTIEGQFQENPDSIVTTIYGTICIPNIGTNIIHIDKFLCSDPGINIETQDGNLVIQNCSDSLRRVELRKILSIALYPNPASDNMIVNIVNAEEGNYSLMIYNLQGLLLSSMDFYSIKSNFKQQYFTIDHYPDGIYQCIIRTPSSVFSRMLAIIH